MYSFKMKWNLIMGRNGKRCVTPFSMNVRNAYCLKSIIFDHILEVFLSCIDQRRMGKKCHEIGVFFNIFFCVQIHNNVHVHLKRNIYVYLCNFYRWNENARGEGSSQWKRQESQQRGELFGCQRSVCFYFTLFSTDPFFGVFCLKQY